jgi:hypothetical protein
MTLSRRICIFRMWRISSRALSPVIATILICCSSTSSVQEQAAKKDDVLKTRIGHECTITGKWSNRYKLGPCIRVEGSPEIYIDRCWAGRNGYQRVTITLPEDGTLEHSKSSVNGGIHHSISKEESARLTGEINKLYRTYKDDDLVTATGRLCYYETRCRGAKHAQISFAIPFDHYFFPVDEVRITPAEAKQNQHH